MSRDNPISKYPLSAFPLRLSEIPEPPKELFIRGILPDKDSTFLTVVGSRACTRYGSDATKSLIEGLMGYDIVVVSGLAIGIDVISHETALNSGLTTVAFPGSGLDSRVLYPATNARVAEQIVEKGGALISEYEPMQGAQKYFFPERNRLMAGISSAVLIVEASKKSGTLITARLALDYNRDVLAVPGPIGSDMSTGPNMLIKEGAIPVTESSDILTALGIDIRDEKDDRLVTLSEKEAEIVALLNEPLHKDDVVRSLSISAQDANILFTQMELKKLIRIEDGYISKV